jgi:hypothetical protein
VFFFQETYTQWPQKVNLCAVILGVKTTGQPLKRTAAVSAVIETAREIMQNAPHTSVRQLSQRNRLNLMLESRNVPQIVTKRRR